MASTPGTSGGSKQMSDGKSDDSGRKAGDPRKKAVYRMPFFDKLSQGARRMVSQNRARFEYQNLDLDLAYITDRIIAMGYPSKGAERHIRNTMEATKEFLWRRHGSHHVKVFNLRGGFYYDPRHFDNNVITFDMVDHHPPSLELMAPFCREAQLWLEDDPKNVIAVHCKAGKGRTGVMICAFLCYINFYPNPRQILDYYSIVRTKNNKGVTIPSQRRYIYYYNTLRKYQLNYFPNRMQLVGVYIENPPRTAECSAKLRIKVSNHSTIVFAPPDLVIGDTAYRRELHLWRDRRRFEFPHLEYHPDTNPTGLVSNRAYCYMVPDDSPVFVEGDVRIDLVDAEERRSFFESKNKKKIGHVWFNTMFVSREMFKNEDLPNVPPRDFIYGDAEWPYLPGQTSISKKRLVPEQEEELFDTETDPANRAPRRDGLKIVKPPGLDVHTTADTLASVYEEYGIAPPRHRISHLLHEAHDNGIVTDEYNERKAKEVTLGFHVVAGNIVDRITGVGGPYQIPRREGEHVLTFPVYEMDRALKNKKLDHGMKLFVVLKNIDPEDAEMVRKSNEFCETTYQNNMATFQQQPSVPAKYTHHANPPGADLDMGAESSFRPAVRYAIDGTYDGTAHPTLERTRYQNIEQARDRRWCRYFYRQRADSLSKYPIGLQERPVVAAQDDAPDAPDDSNGDGNDAAKEGGSDAPGTSSKKNSRWIFGTRSKNAGGPGFPKSSKDQGHRQSAPREGSRLFGFGPFQKKSTEPKKSDSGAPGPSDPPGPSGSSDDKKKKPYPPKMKKDDFKEFYEDDTTPFEPHPHRSGYIRPMSEVKEGVAEFMETVRHNISLPSSLTSRTSRSRGLVELEDDGAGPSTSQPSGADPPSSQPSEPSTSEAADSKSSKKKQKPKKKFVYDPENWPPTDDGFVIPKDESERQAILDPMTWTEEDVKNHPKFITKAFNALGWKGEEGENRTIRVLHDLELMKEQGEKPQCHPELWRQWTLQGYAMDALRFMGALAVLRNEYALHSEEDDFYDPDFDVDDFMREFRKRCSTV